MATIEKRGESFRVIFRFDGKRFAKSLNTRDEKSAFSSLARIEDNLHRIAIGTLVIPDEADVCTFLLSDGKQVTQPNQTPEPIVKPAKLSVGELADLYLNGIPEASIEMTTRECLEIHIGHFKRKLASIKDARGVTASTIQDYVNQRAKDPGVRGKKLSARTIKKELVTLKAIWNWGVREGHLSTGFPDNGIRLPKSKEKPPFRTFEDVVLETSSGGLSPEEVSEAWDSVFLTQSEIAELLVYVKQTALHPFIYPMFVFAAYTGARRSEIIVAQLRDCDLTRRRITIHEKKRVRLTYSTRAVPISEFLSSVLNEWLTVHPGSPALFPIKHDVHRANRKGTGHMTFEQATHHFNQTLMRSKWSKLKGWHVFRHSFCSNCASAGVDQRLIDEWVGHQTEEMRRRYRHLAPNRQLYVLDEVFSKT